MDSRPLFPHSRVSDAEFGHRPCTIRRLSWPYTQVAPSQRVASIVTRRAATGRREVFARIKDRFAGRSDALFAKMTTNREVLTHKMRNHTRSCSPYRIRTGGLCLERAVSWAARRTGRRL